MRRATMLCILVVFGMLRHSVAAAGEGVEAAIDAFLIAETEGIERARKNMGERFDVYLTETDEEYAKTATPLHIAAQDGNLAEVKALVEAGADINSTVTLKMFGVEFTMTPLYMATIFGRLDVMEYLLREGADPNAGNESPLYEAAQTLRLDAVKLLLEHGGDPDSTNSAGTPSLLAPFILSYLWLVPPPRVHEALRLLLEAGADPNKGSTYSKPIDYAMRGRDQIAVQLLCQFGAAPLDDPNPMDEMPELHQAARDGDLEKIKTLLRDGADINQPDSYGVPPAYFAAQAGRYAVLEWLAENGADLSIKTERPKDDIFFAAAMGDNLDVLRICLKHGAQADYPAMNGLSPLTWVVAGSLSSRDWNTAVFLIENGADVNWRDESGRTPLHVMAAAHLLNFDRLGMERLIRAGADKDARDKDGLLPLHYAAARNNRRAMAVLMEGRRQGEKRYENAVVAVLQFSVPLCPLC